MELLINIRNLDSASLHEDGSTDFEFAARPRKKINGLNCGIPIQFQVFNRGHHQPGGNLFCAGLWPFPFLVAGIVLSYIDQNAHPHNPSSREHS
jgi:hypothetical protein